MKTRIPHSNLIAVLSLLAIGLAIGRFLFAADEKHARVTEVVQDVHLLAGQNAARPAALNDTVNEGTLFAPGAIRAQN